MMKDKKEKNWIAPLPLGPENLNNPMIRTDPFGSYTGLTKDGEKPVQDADDL